MDQDIYHLLKEKYNFNKDNPGFLKDIKKLKTGYPLAYLIGHIPFLNCKIDLSLKPLIPRPETEFLVGSLLGGCHPPRFPNGILGRLNSSIKILDLCCGSGCIGIVLLKKVTPPGCVNTFPGRCDFRVDFADISPKALKQTQINLNLNKISESRYKLIKSNLFSNIKDKYDLIITNPPYIDKNSQYEKSLKYEPKQALFAPDHGLFYITKILKNYSNHLKPTGHLYLEFAKGQDKKIAKLSHAKPHFIKDQFSVTRFLHLTGN